MSWKVLTRDALTARLNNVELTALAQAGSLNGGDPLEEILADTAALVRGHVRSAGLVGLSADENAVPGELFGAALNYARYDYLTRIRLSVSDDRRKAREEAAALFELVRGGKFKVASPDAAGDGDFAAFEPAGPARLEPNRKRLLD